MAELDSKNARRIALGTALAGAFVGLFTSGGEGGVGHVFNHQVLGALIAAVIAHLGFWRGSSRREDEVSPPRTVPDAGVPAIGALLVDWGVGSILAGAGIGLWVVGHFEWWIPVAFGIPAWIVWVVGVSAGRESFDECQALWTQWIREQEEEE